MGKNTPIKFTVNYWLIRYIFFFLNIIKYSMMFKWFSWSIIK